MTDRSARATIDPILHAALDAVNPARAVHAASSRSSQAVGVGRVSG